MFDIVYYIGLTIVVLLVTIFTLVRAFESFNNPRLNGAKMFAFAWAFLFVLGLYSTFMAANQITESYREHQRIECAEQGGELVYTPLEGNRCWR